jgi:hypothetical protein
VRRLPNFKLTTRATYDRDTCFYLPNDVARIIIGFAQEPEYILQEEGDPGHIRRFCPQKVELREVPNPAFDGFIFPRDLRITLMRL